MTQVVSLTNLPVPAAPATYYFPNSNGVAVPASATSWTVTTDSPAYSAGSSADLAVEYQFSGVWAQRMKVGGYTLGSYIDSDTGGSTTVNHFGSPVVVIPSYPTHIRLRVDRIPSGMLASLTVDVT